MARSPKNPRKTSRTLWIDSKAWMGLIAVAVFVGVGVGLSDITLVEQNGLQTSVANGEPYGFPVPPENQVQPTRAVITPSSLSILTSEKLILDGGLSTGKNLKYRWEYLAGTPAKDAGISFPTTFTSNVVTDVTLTLAGTHKFGLTVQDDAGITSGAVAYIQVSRTPNRLPVPKFTVNKKSNISFFATGQEIILDAEKSSDPDGTIQEAVFTLSKKPTGSIATAKGDVTNKMKATFVPDKKGYYELKLTIKDNDGGSSEYLETIYVYGAGDCTPAMAGKNGDCDINRISEMIEAFNKHYEITP